MVHVDLVPLLHQRIWSARASERYVRCCTRMHALRICSGMPIGAKGLLRPLQSMTFVSLEFFF